ncbi:RNA-guided endonuclease InsQ/TnpB family protein [Candidatus Poriferisodalis sp.]|uniref:RNA-guided endonuclease InsQ/TnpB family protein n=2 Tax=Candidatus Poriferisodalis sp. TaxID=3101277 RepID=UPI003D0F21E1
MSYVTVRVPVRLSGRRDRLSIWLLLGEQRQAFNRGVGLCLEAVESGNRVPSKFDLHKLLTADRASGRMPGEVPVALQRPGIEAGRDAVLKWDKARGRLERSVVFWAVRLAAAELDAAGEHRSASAVRGAVNSKGKLRKTAAGEVRYCETRLAKARQRQDRHNKQGTGRLFRSRKRFESEPANAAALVYRGGVILGADGSVRLPGGKRLRLADPGWRPPEGHEWTGAIQIVDTTRKVTVRTRPQHRKYVMHVQLRRTDPEPVQAPQSRDEVIGADAGVVEHMALSDGRMLNMADETDLNTQIRELQQQRSRCDHGSRRWRTLSRQLRGLHAKRTNRRDNSAGQIAAEIVSTPGVSVVGVERTNTVGMLASAAGTKEHPGKGVAAKRGLNRALSDARFGGIRTTLERAGVKRGILVIRVPAAGTSMFCHRCGALVARESQSSYWCKDCGIVGNADTLAARNVKELSWQALTANQDTKPAARDFAVERGPGRRETSPTAPAATEILTNKRLTPDISPFICVRQCLKRLACPLVIGPCHGGRLGSSH